MSEQLELAMAPPARTKRRPSIEERFAAFHAANPHVYQTLLRLARRARAAGKERLGMKALWEVCRWEFGLATSGDEFRCNNDFTASYARLLMQEPDLAGMFETRERKTA
jgi:hypothetical protein